MTFFRKKLVFKYKKEVGEENKVYEYPAVNLILGEDENSFETSAVIDSGSDICFISKEVAEALSLELGEEEDADVLGGGSIKVRPSKIRMALVRGDNQIPLGLIPVSVGVVSAKTKESDMGVILGRNPIFDMFKITFEQAKKQITFEKIDPKWRPY